MAALAAFMVPAGNLADRFGRKRLLMGGLAMFGVASLLAGTATQVWARLPTASSRAWLVPSFIRFLAQSSATPRRKSFRSGGGGTTARRTRPVGDRALRAGHRGLACVCRTRPSPVVRAARAARQADFPPPRGQVAPTRNPPLGPWRSVTPMSLRHGRPQTYAKFLERPDQPAQPNERLKKTLRAPAPWKRA